MQTKLPSAIQIIIESDFVPIHTITMSSCQLLKQPRLLIYILLLSKLSLILCDFMHMHIVLDFW